MHFNGKNRQYALVLGKSHRGKYGWERAGELFTKHWLFKINNFDEAVKYTLDEWIYCLKTSVLPEAYRARGFAEVEAHLKTDNTSPETKAKYLALFKGTNITESLIEMLFCRK